MKSYPHILSKLFCSPLVITKTKHRAICKVLEAHLASGKVQMPMDEEMPDPEDMMPDFETGPDTIIPIHGILGKHLSGMEMMSGGCDLDHVNSMIDIALGDSQVRRLIFDFQSPGGEVTGIPETAMKIAGIRDKECVAFTDSECCSGALWLASQCQQFYCTPSSCVGSVGVWCAYEDWSRALQNEGVNVQAISAGKYKLMGAYWKPLTDEEKSMLQADVEKIYGQFKRDMVRWREIQDEFMQGQIFDGERAVEVGIADGLVMGMEEILSDN